MGSRWITYLGKACPHGLETSVGDLPEPLGFLLGAIRGLADELAESLSERGYLGRLLVVG